MCRGGRTLLLVTFDLCHTLLILRLRTQVQLWIMSDWRRARSVFVLRVGDCVEVVLLNLHCVGFGVVKAVLC